MDNLGERIKRLRKEKKMTQEMLGSYFKMTKSGVCDWEIGKSRPDIDKLIKLADILDVELTYLLQGDDPINMDEFEKFSAEMKARGITNAQLKKLTPKEKRSLYMLIEQLVNNIED